MVRLIPLVLLVVSVIIGMGQAEALPLPIASVVASSEQVPNVAENTLDQNLGSRWSAKGDGEWIEYELETCQVVSKLEIAWYLPKQRSAFFEIELSENGRKWVSVLQGESDPYSVGYPETANFKDRYACFVRIVGYGTSVNDWNSIVEVEVWGHANLEIPPPIPIGVILPTQVVAASGAQHPNVATNAADGNFKTRWSEMAETWIAAELEEDWGWDPQPEDMTSWIVVKADNCEVLQGVHISWLQGEKRVSFYSIELSEDGINWRRDHFGVLPGGHDPGDFYFYALDHEFGCFLRITGYGNTTNAWNSIVEIQLEGIPSSDALQSTN